MDFEYPGTLRFDNCYVRSKIMLELRIELRIFELFEFDTNRIESNRVLKDSIRYESNFKAIHKFDRFNIIRSQNPYPSKHLELAPLLYKRPLLISALLSITSSFSSLYY